VARPRDYETARPLFEQALAQAPIRRRYRRRRKTCAGGASSRGLTSRQPSRRTRRRRSTPGLTVEPDDARLLATHGELKAATGDPDGALADWQRALGLDHDDIGALYSTAFLLEREVRLAEAADAWAWRAPGTTKADDPGLDRAAFELRGAVSCGDNALLRTVRIVAEVERTGIEPVTSGLQSRRSPS
jgi:tetratricopeptide (TPR) repeat protein